MINTMKRSDDVIKVFICGEEKAITRLVHQSVKGYQLQDATFRTIGAMFANKSLLLPSKKKITMQIWAISNDPRYQFMRSTYYLGSKGGIITFDFSDRNTFLDIVTFVQELNIRKINGNLPNIPTLLLGYCFSPDSEIEVTLPEVKELAQKLNLVFFNYVESNMDENNIFFRLALLIFDEFTDTTKEFTETAKEIQISLKNPSRNPEDALSELTIQYMLERKHIVIVGRNNSGKTFMLKGYCEHIQKETDYDYFYIPYNRSVGKSIQPKQSISKIVTDLLDFYNSIKSNDKNYLEVSNLPNILYSIHNSSSDLVKHDKTSKVISFKSLKRIYKNWNDTLCSFFPDIISIEVKQLNQLEITISVIDKTHTNYIEWLELGSGFKNLALLVFLVEFLKETPILIKNRDGVNSHVRMPPFQS